MSHHHDDHDHHHHHGHHHHHHSSHEHEHEHKGKDAPPQMGPREKLVKMVEHWIKHNEEHAQSYRDWAQRTLDMGEVEVSRMLKDVADGTQAQTHNLEKVLMALEKGPSSD